MLLSETLSDYVNACFTGLWIQSQEHDDALFEMTQLCQQNSWNLASWNLVSGIRTHHGEFATINASDPLSALQSFRTSLQAGATNILVLENFHRFLQSPEVIQSLQQQIQLGKMDRTFFVVLSPLVQLPPELEKLFVVIVHELPDRDQLRNLAESICGDDFPIPDVQEMESVLDAASGLSRFEAEGAFSLSLARDGRLIASTIWHQKSQMLRKSGLLKLYAGDETFDSLGGLEALKAFTKRIMRRNCSGTANARGVLLLSPPGCGKSAFCKALGNEVGRPVLMLDVGTLLGSLVGQSEQQTRTALATVDAMAPCVLMVDEIEKAFAGAQGSQSDSGVSSRMFGTFLTWLNDHTSDVFVVATSNDISRLPPEFARSERFDAVYFLDFPDREQKDAIWNQYMDHYQIERTQKLPDDTNWTGAEIRCCCRLAALLDVPVSHASENVVPIARTAGEAIDKLKTWADRRCLDAHVGGPYRPIGKKKARLKLNPELN